MFSYFKFIVFIIFLFTVFSCHKKAYPDISDRAVLKNTSTVYPPVFNGEPDLDKGKRIFDASCNRCHGLPDPAQHDQKGWDIILPIMIKRARLENEPAFHIRAWVMANRKKNT